MVVNTETAASSSSSPSTGDAENTDATTAKTGTTAPPSPVDKRSSSGTYKKTPNRLSNVRWKLGEEPYADVDGTDGSIGAQHKEMSDIKDGETVNVKIEYVNPPLEPKQKHLLGSGPEIRMKCQVCHKPLHIAAAVTARKLLQDAGYVFKADRKYKGIEQRVVACACEAGHVVQLQEKFAEMLQVRD